MSTITRMTSTTTDRVFGQLQALLDLDAPAKQFRIDEDEVPVRTPDFIDPETQTVVWIGSDAAIEVPVDLVNELPHLVHRSGWLARTKRYPSEYGIKVTPHKATYTHPAGGSPAYTYWRLFTDTLEGTNA